jgi:hypothetical protein
MSNYIGNSPGIGQDQLYVYSPASGATTLSGADMRGISLAYTVGEPFVEVQVNGTILAPSDYTATTGNTIVLTSGSFNAGDLVVVRARSALSLANTYTQVAADALLALKADIPGAWTSAALVATPSTGAITTASGTIRYKKVGSLCFFTISYSIVANGTGATAISMILPYTAISNGLVSGRENSVTGSLLQGLITNASANMTVYTYNNQYPGGNGTFLILSGVYEIAP